MGRLGGVAVGVLLTVSACTGSGDDAADSTAATTTSQAVTTTATTTLAAVVPCSPTYRLIVNDLQHVVTQMRSGFLLSEYETMVRDLVTAEAQLPPDQSTDSADCADARRLIRIAVGHHVNALELWTQCAPTCPENGDREGAWEMAHGMTEIAEKRLTEAQG